MRFFHLDHDCLSRCRPLSYPSSLTVLLLRVNEAQIGHRGLEGVMIREEVMRGVPVMEPGADGHLVGTGLNPHLRFCEFRKCPKK
jgi:hypothetical protein